MPFLLLSGSQGQPFSSSGIFTDSICYSLLFYVGIKQVGETIRATVSWLTVTTLLALHYAPCMCLPRFNEGVLTRRRQRQAPGPGAASNRAAAPCWDLCTLVKRDMTCDVTCYTCDGDGKQVTGDITSHHHTACATGGDTSTVQRLFAGGVIFISKTSISLQTLYF